MENLKMNIVTIVGLTSALFCLAANASTKMIDCIDEGDEMSWHVSMKSDLSLASHSDNDHETALKQTDISFYDTYPAQTEITFHGQDGKSKIRFVYTQELSKGVLYANTGTKDAFQVNFDCELTKDFINWPEVAQAIKDAPSNGGSTRY